MNGSTRRIVVSLAVVVLLGGVVGLFVVDVGVSTPGPVPFEDTVPVGTDYGNAPGSDDEFDLPKAQVFYSQYEYVVGYRGVERFVDDHQRPDHESRFGHPSAVYVSDFGDASVSLSEDGYPVADGAVGWTDAETAAFVVDSRAATPAGETVVPFADRQDAETFADEYDGAVLTWPELLEREFDVGDAGAAADRVEERHRFADARGANVSDRYDRTPVTTVGDPSEESTIQAAVDAAPPESTVVVPDGTYEERVEIDRPITLVGEDGATIDAGGEGTAIELSSERAAVADLEITGVGNATTAADREAGPADLEDTLEMAYGAGDAGIEFENASAGSVRNVTIETPANGVLLRDSPRTVLENVTVVGTDGWTEGSMGVLSIRSPESTIEASAFVGGRDGIYTHRSDGSVYRNNTFDDHRIGVHMMYTSETLVAGNDIDGVSSTGIDVMTDPTGNAIVGNEISNASRGVLTEGTDSYIAENVVTGAEVGMTTGAANSRYEGNLLLDNDEGMRANQLLPTNVVSGNDFVGNDRHADAHLGVLRVWASDDGGNYWEGAVGAGDGRTLERAYSPTDPVDRRLHDVDGTPTLAQAPAVDGVSTFETAVAGMRDGSIVDPAPLCKPAAPDRLESVDGSVPEASC